MIEIKGNSKSGLFGATLGFFFGFAAIALFSSTAGVIKDALMLDPFLVGFLVAAPALSGSLLRIPFAAWVDTTGGRKPFLVLLTLSIIGMSGLCIVISMIKFGYANAGLYPLLLLFGVLSGCGVATFSVGTSQVAYWFPQSKQGAALGIYAGVGNLAPGIFSLILPLALLSIGLIGSYIIWLVFLVIGTLLYKKFGLNAWYFQLIEKGWSKEEAVSIAQEQYGQEVFPKGNLATSLILSAKRRKTWALVSIYFTTFGGFIALTAWLPTYWKMFYGQSTIVAGGLCAFFSISSSLVRILGGKVSDTWGGENTSIAALSVMFIGALMMSFSSFFILSLCASLLLAVGMGIANAAVFKLIPQEVPDAVGGASGWVGGLGAFGGFVLPPLLGIFVKHNAVTGYSHGFFVFVVLAFISLGFSCLLKIFQQPETMFGNSNQTIEALTNQ